MKQAWEKAKQILQKRLGPANFGIWIDPLRLNSYGDDWIALQSQGHHYDNYIEENFYTEIEDALKQATGQNIHLRFSKQNNSKSPPVNVPQVDRRSIPSNKHFNNFVVGACNQFAHAAALAVAESPGDNQYNPLFIFGATGLGKTHLLYAIGNHVQQENPEIKPLYVTAEQFTNQMISAIRHKEMSLFHAKYRDNCQLLLVDDIQFFSGKDGIQEEFFHTFEWLKERGKQTVFTADVLPRDIKGLAPRLQTRFESGMLADTQPPDMETMLAILQQKAEHMNMMLDNDVRHYIASGVRGNVRELEGVLNRLEAICRLHKSHPTMAFVRLHFGKILHQERPQLQPDEIIHAVATTFAVRTTDIRGSKRTKNIVRPRHIAMWLIRQHTEYSFPDIGTFFGNRDHTSVQYACNKIATQLKKDPDLRNTINLIERNLSASSDFLGDQ